MVKKGQMEDRNAPLTDRAIRRGLRLNIVAGTFGKSWFAIVGGYPLTMFLECVRASGVLIGLVTTVQQLALMMQIPGALIAERLDRRRFFWAWVCIPHRVMWIIPALLPWLWPGRISSFGWVVVATAALSSMLGQMGNSAWWSWMTDLVPERDRARFWAVRQSVLMTAYVLALVLIGYVLDVCPDPRQPGGSFLGFSIIFTLAALWGTTDILVHMGVPEPAPMPVARIGNILARVVAPMRTQDFRRLTLAMSAWAFSIGIMGPFGVLFLNRVFHIGYGGFSATAIAGALGPILGGLIWGYVMDRIGTRSFAAIMMVLAPLCGLAWFIMLPVKVIVHLPWLAPLVVPQPVLVLGLSSILAGMLYSGVGLSQISLLSAVAPSGNRTMAMAVHWCAVGLAGAAGPLIGGWIMDVLARHPIAVTLPNGIPLGFFHVLVGLHMLLAWAVALPLMLRVQRRAGEPAFRTAVSRLYFGNPLRTVGNILNIYNTIAPGGTSVERADAVRRLGESRMRIAVRDLIEKMDDPASDVREEAALALGRIGSTDAVDALVKKLADPQADLAPQIARALRRARDPRSVDALLQRLRDPDRETAAESARALGEIGDLRAADPLLDLLHASSDTKVVSASSEALARLGAMAAIYEILPRLRETTNAVLKNSLAVAVGNLLGTPGEFYTVLAREQRARGGEVERLVGHLQRSIERASRLRLTAEGRRLSEKTARALDLFEARNHAGLVEHLFDLAIGLAALHCGIEYGGDSESFIELLIWHDTRFGVTVWYLDLLREAQSHGRALTDTELVLGIYALSKWCGVHEKGVYGDK